MLKTAPTLRRTLNGRPSRPIKVLTAPHLPDPYRSGAMESRTVSRLPRHPAGQTLAVVCGRWRIARRAGSKRFHLVRRRLRRQCREKRAHIVTLHGAMGATRAGDGKRTASVVV